MQSKPQDDLLLVLASDLDDALVRDPAFPGGAKLLAGPAAWNGKRVKEIAAAIPGLCGDGGNDLDMLQLNYRGVLVANGSLPPSLLPSTVYRASKPYAVRILEALRHFGLAP